MIAYYTYTTREIYDSGSGKEVNKTAYITVPEHCPMCHGSISPLYLKHHFNYDKNLFTVYYECTKCKKTFLAYYKNPSNKMGEPTNIDELYPKFAKERNFDKEILDLSPIFTKVYNQSVEAEANELDELAGMGYRKSLEFLIKDFCILKNQDKEEDIKKKLLGKVIDTYIDSPKIKNLAKVSAWIGNDETHYIKQNDNLDINDLKKFIEATVHFISYELLSDDAEELVADKSQKND